VDDPDAEDSTAPIPYDEEQAAKNAALRKKRFGPKPGRGSPAKHPQVGEKSVRARGRPAGGEKAICFCGAVFNPERPAFKIHMKHYPKLCKKRAGP
jgi:hypothetical protein